MQPLDILYITLSIGVIILTGTLVVVAYSVALTLQRVRSMLVDVQEVTHLANMMKQGTHVGVLSIAGWVLRQLLYKRR